MYKIMERDIASMEQIGITKIGFAEKLANNLQIENRNFTNH